MFTPHIIGVSVRVCVYKCWNAELSSIRSVRYRIEKLTMPGLVQYRTKPRQFVIFLVWYRTGIIDAAGMPMPVLVSSMPMPSSADKTQKLISEKTALNI
jgi:hypothetical protein